MNASLAGVACGVLLALASSPARGLEPVRFMGIAGRPEENAPLPAVFSDQKEEIDLELDMPSTSSVLRADVFEVAGDLALPLAKGVVLKSGFSFPTASLQHLRVPVKFPDAKRHTVIMLRLACEGTVAQAPVSLGELKFEVFPVAITKELLDLVRTHPGGPNPVTIFGPGHLLRQFLTDSHVSFNEGGSDVPRQFDPDRLYLGEWPSDSAASPLPETPAEPGHVAIFAPDDSVPPGVYVERSSPAGPLVRVTLPVLSNLKDDPRAQLALIKVIHLLSNPASPTN
jgi:hypothetical protein